MADVTLDLRLNSQSFLADLANARSQAGMTLGGPMAAASSGMGLAAAGAATGLGQMAGGFGQPSFGFGQSFGFTHTPQDIGLNPHYGNIHAYSTGMMEAQIERHGLAAAAALAPPGVAPAEFAMSVQQNRIEREVQSQTNAQLAARSTGFGMAAGMGADMIVGGIAGWGLGKIGGKLGGAAGAGVGKLIGGFGVGMLAWDVAQEMVADHYAKVEQIGGYTRELGEIAGSGRGLSRLERYNLGVAARGAAKDINMDVNTMGDILATAGAMNMMPDATDPTKARQQFSDFARTIREGAQVLQSSLAEATQVIKQATEHGMTAREGIVKAAGMGGVGAFSQYIAFGEQGASVARSMRYTGGQGFSLFTGALGQMSGAGLTDEEMMIMGGRQGAAAFLGQTQMAVAQSGVGRMQLMAATSGQQLGGLMDMPGQALAAMGGGDMMTNLASFMVNEDEYRRGIGARGIKTMARQQITAGAEFIQDFMGLDTGEARRFAAMQMYGMNATQAKAYVGGLFSRGGGPDRYDQQARAALALQGANLSRGITPMTADELEAVSAESGLDFTWAKRGAMAGASIGGLFGTIPGALVSGGIGGLVGGAFDMASYLGGDQPALTASAEEKADFYQRRDAARIDEEMMKRRAQYGYAETTESDVSAFLQAKDLTGITWGENVNPTLAGQNKALMNYMGLRTINDVQRAANGRYYNKKPSVARRREFGRSAADAFDKLGADGQMLLEKWAEARQAWLTAPGRLEGTGLNIGGGYAAVAKSYREKLMAAGIDPESDEGLRWAEQRTGMSLDPLTTDQLAVQGGAAVTSAREAMEAKRAGAVARAVGQAVPRAALRIDASEIDPELANADLQKLVRWGRDRGETMQELRGDINREGELNLRLSYKGRPVGVVGNQIVMWDSDPNAIARANKAFESDAMERARDFDRRAENAKSDSERARWRAKASEQAKIAFSDADVTELANKDLYSKELDPVLKAVREEGGVPVAASTRKKRRKGIENAVGFGAREESMDLINKSLRRTHQMLEQLEKKINPPKTEVN